MDSKYKKLFEPVQIGSMTVKNRFAMAPMASFGLVDAGGVLTDDGIEYFVTRARGGISLIITGTCFVDEIVEEIRPHTLMCSQSTDLWKEKQQFNRLAERIHAYGGKIIIQLASGYGRSARIPGSAGRAVAPSEITNRWDPEITHKEMTTEEVEQIVERFAIAAAFCKECGIDGVEIHAVHEGYLLDQFTVEYFNHRTDKYGGSFENRFRFAREIVEAIKEKCGAKFPVLLRYTVKHMVKGLLDGAVEGEEFEEKGRDYPEGIRAAKYLEEVGYDALDVDLGCYDAHFWNHPSVYQKDALYLEAAEMVKKAVNIPVIVAGRMDNPDTAVEAIESGKCDIISLGRPSLADPEIPLKIARGQIERIRPCISCNFGCCNNVHAQSGRAGCAVNAQCAHELVRAIKPLVEKKKVVIIGGGPGGCECGIVLAKRGHEVVLLEASDALGGALKFEHMMDFKHHDKDLIAYYGNELKRLGVDVRLNTPGTVETVKALAPDVVVTAVGALPFVPPIPGKELSMVATDAIQTPEKIGHKVVIIGAGQVGVEAGLWLLKQGHEVTIVEATRGFMPKAIYSDAEHAAALIKFYGGKVIQPVNVQFITEDHVEFMVEGGQLLSETADTVLTATGYRGDMSVYNEMSKEFPEVYNIGDSVMSRNVYYAVREAYELANNL